MRNVAALVTLALASVTLNGCDNGSSPTSTSGQGGSASTATGAGGQGGAAQTGSTGDGATTSTSTSTSMSTGAGGDPTQVRGYYSTNPAEFGGPTRCAKLNAQLCEDFESGTLDKSLWEVGGNAPVIETGKAMRGAHSAHFHTDLNGLSFIKEKKTFPAVNNTFWGRMFFYIDALPVTPDYAHFTLVEAAGTGDDSRVREGGQYRKFGVGTDGGPTGDWTNIDADPTKETAKEIPEKQWMCVEWLYKGDTSETRFFADGVEHPSLYTFPKVQHGANSSVEYNLPSFDSVWVGWWMYQSNPTPDHFDVWIDEIAIDKDRIGCSL
jgi:hypothetical protein